jgi:hypothetical protein
MGGENSTTTTGDYWKTTDIRCLGAASWSQRAPGRYGHPWRPQHSPLVPQRVDAHWPGGAAWEPHSGLWLNGGWQRVRPDDLGRGRHRSCAFQGTLKVLLRHRIPGVVCLASWRGRNGGFHGNQLGNLAT